MKLINLMRGAASAAFEQYDLWRIYSIQTPRCGQRDSNVRITPIEDLAIFDDPSLEDELRRANWYRPGALGYAAWSGGNLAGVCWFWPGPLLEERNVGLQPDDCVELIQITVSRACRGQGIAPALIRHGVCALREHGFSRLYAQVWRTNTASMRAFEKCGWDHVAWFLRFKPRFSGRPFTIRRIRSPFRSEPGLLENWRKGAEKRSEAAAAWLIECKLASQSLKFTFGDLTLAEYRFRALVSETPATSLLGISDPPVPPQSSVDRSLAGVVIRNFPASRPLRTFAFCRQWLRYVPVRYDRFLVERKGSFEQYLQKFSSKSRKNLRRSVKAVAETVGSHDCWREYRTPEEIAEFHRLAAGISSKTYQTRLFHEGLESTEETRRHFDTLAAQNLVRGYLLFVHEEPAAFALCEVKNNVLLYKTVGYAPEYRDLSPGTVLLWYILERLFAEGTYDYLDFGEGGGFYKEFFSNLSMPCARVYYFRRRPLLLAVVGVHAGWNLVIDLLRRLPAAPELIKRLRKSLRHHATDQTPRPAA
jgi:ribosomal protein S18 acetylase RimI-like enzyme